MLHGQSPLGSIRPSPSFSEPSCVRHRFARSPLIGAVTGSHAQLERGAPGDPDSLRLPPNGGGYDQAAWRARIRTVFPESDGSVCAMRPVPATAGKHGRPCVMCLTSGQHVTTMLTCGNCPEQQGRVRFARKETSSENRISEAEASEIKMARSPARKKEPDCGPAALHTSAK